MFLTDTALRGIICMLAAWLEWPWDSYAKDFRLRWSRLRCGLYLVTISLAPLRAAVHPKAWFWWYMAAPTARALALLAAQVEIAGWPSWIALVATAGTLTAINPPFGHLRDLHHRIVAIIYAWGFLTGVYGKGPHEPLRWMMTALALLEVLYFTGGWEWGVWWLFPVAQTAVKWGAWLYVQRLEK